MLTQKLHRTKCQQCVNAQMSPSGFTKVLRQTEVHGLLTYVRYVLKTSLLVNCTDAHRMLAQEKECRQAGHLDSLYDVMTWRPRYATNIPQGA